MTSIPKILYAIGDFHIGNQNYRSKLLFNTLEKIAEVNGKLLLMGDYCEFINERSFKYESQTISPKLQFKRFKRLFTPFAEAGLIVACLKGNHEDRYFSKLDGLEDWCDQYNIKYNGRHIFFRFGNKYIYAHHPKTSATTTAGRDRVFKKMRDIQDADIYLSGHFHSLFQEKSYKYTKKGKLATMYFGCTGSYLDYKNSYAEQKLYAPNKLGCKKIIIYKNKIEMEDFI